MNRRDFIKTGAAAGVLAGFVSKSAFASSKPSSPANLVLVRNGEADEMFDAGIEAMGGLSAFVKKGSKVLIKPNISFSQPPEFGASVNPKLLERVVKACYNCGASEVVVYDHLLAPVEKCFSITGAQKAVKAGGGVLLPANVQREYVSVDIPEAKLLKKTDIFYKHLECDVFINISILKHHGGAKMSGAIKNLMGCVWNRRVYHGEDLSQCIADFTMCKKCVPTLNIVDAYRVLRKNGPRGKGPQDAEIIKYQILGTDIVAVDTASMHVFGTDPKEVTYIKAAEDLGAGSMDLSKAKVARITV